MTRILISAMPFAGHVAPITGVVAELVARGHHVTAYTGARYVERFAAVGAHTLSWESAPDFDESDLPATFPQVGRRGPPGVLANLEHVFIGTGPGQARDILAAHDRRPFDVIAGDVMSLGTGLAAEVAGPPWATLSIVPLSLPDPGLPPSGLALHPGRGLAGRIRDGMLRTAVQLATRPLDRALRQARASVGLAVGEPFAGALYSPDLVIATGTRSLEYPRRDLGSRFEFVGRLPSAGGTPPEPPPWRDELDDGGRPVVLVTQGTFNVDPTDLLLPTIAALADRDVLVIGTTVGARIADPIPSNVRLADRLDFADILPHVDVMITNGGWGGVLEGLAHGIPLIVAGGDLDKPDIAARVAWSGVGIDLRTGRPSASAVGRAFARLTEEASFGVAARRIGDEIVQLGGPGRAADLIEMLARGASSPSSAS